MKIPNRILLPTDFTPNSVHTLKYAAAIATEKKMALSLLYCYPEREYERKYDFENEEYSKGIQDLMRDFYQLHMDEVDPNTRFLARQGSLAHEITDLSGHFQLIILKGKNTSQRLTHWLKDWMASIVSGAHCPVLIIPPTLRHRPWNKIWHIHRKESEIDILTRELPLLEIPLDAVESKTLNQKKFKSNSWKSIVQYFEHPSKKLHRSIVEHRPKGVDLIILISHRKSSFTKFLHNESSQILFQLSIPVLIFQAETDA